MDGMDATAASLNLRGGFLDLTLDPKGIIEWVIGDASVNVPKLDLIDQGNGGHSTTLAP
jgi:hypothetical protein